MNLVLRGQTERFVDLYQVINQFVESDKTNLSHNALEIYSDLTKQIYSIDNLENPELDFNRAAMLYTGIGLDENKSAAIEIWDQMIDHSLESKIDSNNLIPSVMAKYYYIASDMLDFS